MVKVLLADPALSTLRDRFAAELPASVEVGAVSTWDAAEFAKMAADATIVVNARRRIDSACIRMAPALRFIQLIGAGTDSVDLAAARDAGITVAYNPRVNATGAAEHTVMLMLALVKRLPMTESLTRQGRFATSEVIAAGIDDLADSTVGLIGFGQIGQAVAERLVPFGASIAYHSRRPIPDAEVRVPVHWLPLQELLTVSTIVSLHVPLTPATRHLIGASELASMPPGSYLVNAGRGGLVDEGALRDAVVSGHLAGAALDVLENETDGTNPFSDLPQVIVTPHLGGGSRNSMTNVVTRSTANIRRFLAGDAVRDQL